MKNVATTSPSTPDQTGPSDRASSARPRKRAKPSPAPTAEAVLEGLLLEATLFDKSASQANRIKAWELIGKHLGMFRDRKDESEPVSVHFDIKF